MYYEFAKQDNETYQRHMKEFDDRRKLKQDEEKEITKQYFELREVAINKGYRIEGACLYKNHETFKIPGLNERTIPTTKERLQYLIDEVYK